MALVKIGGTALPDPTELSVGVLDISKAERNANGYMMIEKIATKKKLELKYAYVTDSELKTILQALSPLLFTVEYIDPVENNLRTSSFYCGDRNVGYVDYRNGIPRYKDLTFNLIER
jgi:hypothetical protein